MEVVVLVDSTLSASSFIAALVALVSAAASVWNVRRTRRGTYAHAVLEKRLIEYDELMSAMDVLALYFPHSPIDQRACSVAGEKLRKCYFSGTGILLSKRARARYMVLLTAISRAAAADSLDVPGPRDYPNRISDHSVVRYRTLLHVTRPKRLYDRFLPTYLLEDRRLDRRLPQKAASWRFGRSAETSQQALQRGEQRSSSSADRPNDTSRDDVGGVVDDIEDSAAFRDYVFLQYLTSRLRSALADDIGGRRRPK